MTWPFFNVPGNPLYEAPNDPNDAAPGIWLGPNVSPSTCFADQAASITDADLDWLDDNCEFELAKGFAPHWGMAAADPCVGGEPHWAAKYFRGSQSVRIAYMPSYYMDCGRPQFGAGAGHSGDSEFAMVQVTFNASTRHWEFQLMFLSAHDGTGNHRSTWNTPSMTTFTRHPLAHPYVEVSTRKHANYTSRSKCQQAFIDFESCDNGQNPTMTFRFPVLADRNVGSRHHDMGRGCVSSSNVNLSGNGRTECFYTERFFRGWQAEPWFGDAPAPYRSFLVSPRFEEKYPDGDASACDWYWRAYGQHGCAVDAGPGPAPYSPSAPVYYAQLFGSELVRAGATCLYTASSNLPNATYTWLVNGSQVATGPEYYHTAGSTSFQIEVYVSSEAGAASAQKYVQIGGAEAAQCGEI